MPLWGQIVGFVSVLVAILGTVYKLARAIEQARGQIDGRLERLELRIAVLEGQNRAFLQVFPKVIAGLVKEHVLTVETGMSFVSEALGSTPLVELFKDIKPTINPLSQTDVDTLRAYVERLRAGQPITQPEAQDFYRITNIVTHEYPANENGWLLFLVGGFLSGAMAADVSKT